MIGLSASEQARARGRVYGLFAKLLLDGLDQATLARLRALDGWLGADAIDDLDAIAAEHHAILQLELHPYAGVFLDGQAAAGAQQDVCWELFAEAGFQPRLDAVPADHLGVGMAFCSFVCMAAAEAHEDGRAPVAARLEHVLARFCDRALLSYLPSLVVALAGAQGFWPRVLDELLELVAEHRASLPGARERVVLPDAAAPLLDDPHTGLRDIAEYLLTPARSGVFLTRSDLAALGRRRELPRGFGPRLLTLDNMLRSAVDYGQLAGLLADLDTLLTARADALAGLGDRLGVCVAPWQAAIADTRTLVSTIAAASYTQPGEREASPRRAEPEYGRLPRA
jgi:TorA maturation chaperone TorD